MHNLNRSVTLRRRRRLAGSGGTPTIPALSTPVVTFMPDTSFDLILDTASSVSWTISSQATAHTAAECRNAATGEDQSTEFLPSGTNVITGFDLTATTPGTYYVHAVVAAGGNGDVKISASFEIAAGHVFEDDFTSYVVGNTLISENAVDYTQTDWFFTGSNEILGSSYIGMDANGLEELELTATLANDQYVEVTLEDGTADANSLVTYYLRRDEPNAYGIGMLFIDSQVKLQSATPEGTNNNLTSLYAVADSDVVRLEVSGGATLTAELFINGVSKESADLTSNTLLSGKGSVKHQTTGSLASWVTVNNHAWGDL